MNLNDMIVSLSKKNMSRECGCALAKWDTLITASPRLFQCMLTQMFQYKINVEDTYSENKSIPTSAQYLLAQAVMEKSNALAKIVCTVY